MKRENERVCFGFHEAGGSMLLNPAENILLHVLRNLIAFTKDGSDPFIRLYLLPDKSRPGRRKTTTAKRTLNPVYDQT